MELRKPLEEETLAEVGYRNVVSVPGDATVGDAVRAMQAEKVGACCVIDGEELRGIFTERNLVARVFGAGLSLDAPVADCMTPNPVTCGVDDALHVVLTKLHQGGFRHIPVVDANGRAIGTTSVKRAVRFMGRHMRDVVYNVAPEPGQFPDRPEGG